MIPLMKFAAALCIVIGLCSFIAMFTFAFIAAATPGRDDEAFNLSMVFLLLLFCMAVGAAFSILYLSEHDN